MLALLLSLVPLVAAGFGRRQVYVGGLVSSASSSTSSQSRHMDPQARYLAKRKPTPHRPSPHTQYILLHTRHAWEEADKLCWWNGYEPAALDSHAAKRVARWVRRGPQAVASSRILFKSFYHGKRHRSARVCLLSIDKKKKASVARLGGSEARHLRLRTPILCQLRDTKRTEDPFFHELRRPYCSKPETVCLLGKEGPECLKLCAIGEDQLKGKAPGISHGHPTRRYYREIKQFHYSSDSSDSS